MAPRDISSTEPYQRDNPLHFLMCALLQCPQAYVQTSVGTGHGLAACWPSHRPCKGLINDYQNRLMGSSMTAIGHAAGALRSISISPASGERMRHAHRAGTGCAMRF